MTPLLRRARAKLLRWRAKATLRRPERICLGCGNAKLVGWLNVDLAGAPDLRLDVREPLPFADASARFVYSEHLIEHLELEDALLLLKECRRILRDDGVLRIATPDLATLVERYRGAWRDQEWLAWPEHAFIDTPARMLNVAFHAWGHRHLYDEAELRLRLASAGFANVTRVGFGASEHEALRGLETRADSLLICEAGGRTP